MIFEYDRYPLLSSRRAPGELSYFRAHRPADQPTSLTTRERGALCCSLVMPRLLSEEIDDAVREVKFIEESLSGSAGCDAGGSGSYLGLTDRGTLLELLLCARRQLNLLREKEVAILKSSAAAGGRSNQHFGELWAPHPAACNLSVLLLCRIESQHER